MKKIENKQMILMVLETELRQTKEAHDKAVEELNDAWRKNAKKIVLNKLNNQVSEMYGRYTEVKYIYDMLVKEQ